MARAISLRPAPTSPASATISPERTVKDTSWNSPSWVSPSTTSTSSPITASCFGNRLLTSRPTICLTIFSTVVSLIGLVAM